MFRYVEIPYLIDSGITENIWLQNKMNHSRSFLENKISTHINLIYHLTISPPLLAQQNSPLHSPHNIYQVSI